MVDKSTLSYGALRLEIDAETPADELFMIRTRIDDDRAIMREQASWLHAQVQSNIEAGPGPALTQESIERKRRAGYPPTPLMGSGAMKANLRERSRKGYAAVKRGAGEPFDYEMLQEFGVGRLEPRPHMNVPEAVEALFAENYERWIWAQIEQGSGG